MSSYNNEGSRLPDKKKNDLLKKFLNAQEYTKTLKKNASNLVQQTNYATFSYDEIQTYPEIPQSAKLPSNKTFSKELIHSIDTLNNDSNQYSIKAKSKKSHGHINLTQSSNEIPYLKNKKSSYSQMQKSQGNKSIGSKVLTRDPPIKTTKQYDVHSMNKQKYPTQALHQSLGGLKTQSFFKLQSKKSFNYSNTHEYQSEKLSAEDKHSYQRLNRKAKRLEDSYVDLVRQQTNQVYLGPYNLSPSNFMKLINKVQELQAVIMMYQQAINVMKKKIIKQEGTIREQKMMSVFVDQVKSQLNDQKVKNAELREKIGLQDMQIKEFENIMLESIEKVSKHYENELGKITILEKENHFLKFMLRLQIQQNPQTQKIQNKNLENKIKNRQQKDDQDPKSLETNKMNLSKNLIQFKEKFTKFISDKNKNQPN